MSETVDTTPARRQDIAALLAGVPLFAGIPADELAELAGVVRRREIAQDELLWREGDEADGLHVIVDGRVAAALRLPGGGEVVLASMGSGELLGELALLDAGSRTAMVRVQEAGTLLSMARPDFAALVSQLHPIAFTLKRRIAAIACERLRRELASLAGSLGGHPDAALPAADVI